MVYSSTRRLPHQFVLGVVGSDAHCVANQLLQRELVFRNCKVLNLGVALSPEEVVNGIRSLPESTLLLGTLNGDLNPTISTISMVRAEFGKAPQIVVGGNLILGEGGRDRSLDLLNAGANLVVKNCATIEEAVSKILNFCQKTKSLVAF